MRQQIAFSYKQSVFVNWCMTHLPFVHLDMETSGTLAEPITKNIIACVYYYKSPYIVAVLLNLIIYRFMWTESAKCNEAKCIKYGLLEPM